MRKIILFLALTLVACTTTKKVNTSSSVKEDSTKVVNNVTEKDSSVQILQAEVIRLKSELVNVRLSIAEITSDITELENVRITESEYNTNGTLSKTKTYEKSKNSNKSDKSSSMNVNYAKELKQKYDSLIRIQDTHIKYLLEAYTKLDTKIRKSEETSNKQKKTVAIAALIVFFIFVGIMVYIYFKPVKTFTPNIKIPIHPLHKPKATKT